VGDVIDGQTGKEVRNNRRRLGGAVLAAAVGGALGELGGHALGLGNDHNGGGGGNGGEAQATDTTNNGGAGAPAHAPENNGGGSNPSDNSDTTPKAGEHDKGDTLKLKDFHGNGNDTIETELSHYLDQHGYDGSNQQDLQKVTQAVLDHQGISWEDATRLPVGYKFEVPPSVLEQLDKKS
jgi:hypothetical protein